MFNKKPRSFLLPILLFFFTTLVNAQDMSMYYTVMHPDEFTIDWAGFYKANTEETARVRQEYPHHLNLTYGTDSQTGF